MPLKAVISMGMVLFLRTFLILTGESPATVRADQLDG